jgi:hypothetical protein
MGLFFKPRLRGLATMLMIASFLAFLAFYIPNYIIYDGITKFVPEGLYYFYTFFGELVSFLLVPLSVSFILYRYSVGGSARSLILPALALAATKCVYNLPYYYLYETAYGSDWMESTTASLLLNLLYVTLDLAIILLLTWVAAKIVCALAKRKRDDADDEPRITMLNTPEYKALFTVSLITFIYKMVFEVIDIAAHLAEFGSFRSSELLYVVLRLVFFVILLLVSYILQALLYKTYNKGENDVREN